MAGKSSTEGRLAEKSMEDVLFSVNPKRKEYLEQKKVYQIEVEITNKCVGGCNYCYACSTPFDEETLPKDLCFRLVDEGKELGLASIMWAGGDAQLHPDWYEILTYTGERGIGTGLSLSGLISKKEAQQLRELELNNPHFEAVCIHLDTIDPEAYARINDYPKSLDAKIQGYRYLLELGFPPHKINPIICLTKPIVSTIEKTIDWYIDEMGAGNISSCVFKPMGFGDKHRDYEPSLSEVKRFMEYLAKKSGMDRLETGPTPLGTVYCRTSFMVHSNGDVTPCAVLPHLIAGNIYKESLVDIFHKHRETLLFECGIKGICGDCVNKEVCNGCRANAYWYIGDLYASDPKCWFNPEAQEYYLA